jgi:hypothetical protein
MNRFELLQKEQEASPQPGTLFRAAARYRAMGSADWEEN